MKKIGFVFLFILSSSCVSRTSQSPSTPSVAARENQLYSALSLEDLAQVGHVILSAFEHRDNSCQIPEKNIPILPQVYRAALDEKYSEMQDQYTKMSLKEKMQFWTNPCETNCACGTYVGFSEYLETSNIHVSQTEKKAVQMLQQKMEQEGSSMVLCLKKSQWVCESRVLRQLQSRL